MIASQDLVRQLTLPKLMPGVQETPYQADQLAAAIDVFARAYSGRNEQELSAEEWAHRREDEAPYITRVYGLETTVQTWTGLECEGKLIGCSFGAIRDNRMSLDEVVLLPEFHGKGLGRYLTIRCLQRFYESYGGPDRYFFLEPV